MLKLTRDGSIARLTFGRPAARNAIAVAGWHELAAGIAQAAEGARVIILSGEGAAFSAGADLGELALLAGDAALRAPFRIAMRAGIEAVAASPVPVIAAVHGGCLGAGVALTLACDLRVAAADARFAIPPARFGIGYPQADVDRLVATIGRGQAGRMLLAGEAIDAAEALRIGLVQAITDDGGQALAEAIAGNVSESVALLRRQIGGMDTADADAAFDDRFASVAFESVADGLLERLRER